VGGRAIIPSRAISLLITLALVALVAYLWNNDAFIVRSADIGGVRYMPVEEVYTTANIAGQHILQVDPAAVQQRLDESPSLEEAQVNVEWPARVIIVVREREPAIVWAQGANRYWVDLNGHLMLERRPIPSLLQVINEGQDIPFQCPGPACAEQDSITIDPEIVRGAQHLKTLRANIDVLYYDPIRGLSYQDGRGWRAYFVVGARMDTRLIIYETLVASLESQGRRPVFIDVGNPDAPYYLLAQ
jgi:hypothetical protein